VTDDEALIRLDAIALHRRGAPVFEAVDFALGVGECVALLGPNGAGKSSLLHLMVGLDRPAAGRVMAFGSERVAEADFREVRVRAGLVFQDPDDQLFCPTVLDDVAFGPLNLGAGVDEAAARARETLQTLGMASYQDRITHYLSGGEKRMVALATVLAMRPDVLLLDEPTSGLDEQARERLTDHLAALPMAMVLASHDSRLIERLATRAVVLDEGTLRAGRIHSHPHVHQHAHTHVHVAGREEGEHHYPGLGRDLIHHEPTGS
jgi:cobalt/nickel transport system ATP-binding protein